MIIKEFCAENTTLLSQLDSSVKRVELCDNLAVGGTTPSYGVIKKLRAIFTKKKSHSLQ